MTTIISIGGGGFSHSKSDLKLERYILAQTSKKNPKICFLPQASNESQDYVVKFYKAFLSLDAQPSWVSLFGRVEPGFKDQLLQSDIIYVGGGNTKSMLALWREWGIDVILKEAYEKGIVLAGVSAGAICWFEQAVTDSVWPLGQVSGLGFLKGSCCPHYDSEPERAPAFKAMVNSTSILPGIALQDFTGAHYQDGVLKTCLTSAAGKAFWVDKDVEQPLPVLTL